MKTIELMSTKTRAVRAIERLDAAARALWEEDCGVVPVVDSSGALVGVVTDRDMCMASYTQGRPLAEIPVTTVMSRQVTTCRPDDTVAEVMHKMQELQVHRLPVVDARGELVGMVSTNDLVRAAHARPAAVDPSAVIRTLAAIGAPRRGAGAAEAPIRALPASAPKAEKVASPAATPDKVEPAARKVAAAARPTAAGKSGSATRSPAASKPGKAAPKAAPKTAPKSRKRS